MRSLRWTDRRPERAYQRRASRSKRNLVDGDPDRCLLVASPSRLASVHANALCDEAQERLMRPRCPIRTGFWGRCLWLLSVASVQGRPARATALTTILGVPLSSLCGAASPACEMCSDFGWPFRVLRASRSRERTADAHLWRREVYTVR